MYGASLTLRTIGLTAALLALGALGGLLAQAAHLPMPFMLGSLGSAGLATALFQHGALRDYSFPMRFRTLFIGLIGVMIGTQVRPELLNEAGDMLLTLSALALFVVLAHAGNYTIFRRLGRYDRATAYYAGTPGGLMESLVMGERAGADLPLLTAQQFLRIILVITLVPSALSLWLGHPVGSAAGASAVPAAPVSPPALLLILVAAGAGLGIAQVIRLPAGQITGPLLLSAALTLTGAVDLHLPFWLIATAQVVVGVSLGLRFSGMTAAMLRRSLGLSLVSVLFMLALGAGFATLLTKATGLPFLLLMISYSPGGVTEMSVIALSLAANPALVSLHHVVRILFTVGVMSAAERHVDLTRD
ncbi:AbrB family transcriptional regulator [Salipiger sp. P9]|uniref:AbrB family transcriptional regulator n=1 Tax=Salipiger pentaromativorans TaxID=2943193 RepID=UPI0021572A63|nr:AbrB family transcriptional regulator [Salipiger pentaromativorans]MCR8547039.1 AbrB family transcriptional regulator [Salipiger pentaromativorans]